MKQTAILSLGIALWLANRKRRGATHTKTGNGEPSSTASRSGTTSVQRQHTTAPAATVTAVPSPVPVAGPASSTSTAASKSVVGAVLQWIFLILLGAALSLTAAKGSWDVFSVLVAAAMLQLGGQLVRWIGGGNGGNGGSSGGRRVRSPRGSAGSSTPRGTGGGGGGGGGGGLAAPEVPPAAPRVLLPDPRLGGAWVKDPSRSDAMDEATAYMRLNGVTRTAIRLIRGLEIDPAALQGGRLSLAITSVIAFFKVRESYLLDGSVAYFKRRDLRSGKHTASVAVQPDGSVVLSISWGEPIAGTGSDHFVLVPEAAAVAAAAAAAAGTRLPVMSSSAAPADGDLLVVTSTLKLAEAGPAGRPVVYRTTYVRAGRGRQQRQHP